MADEPIGRGRASTVVDLGNGTVLRRGGHPELEAELMEHVGRHGFRVPRVQAVREDGLVLERIVGPTMGDALRRRPWRMAWGAAALAALHERLHAIELDGASVIHLDLHPENVMLGPEGPVVIDWTNARTGDPDMDVALTWLILRTSAGLPGRVLAQLFLARAGRSSVRAGLDAAAAFRIADPNVTDAERARPADTGVAPRCAEHCAWWLGLERSHGGLINQCSHDAPPRCHLADISTTRTQEAHAGARLTLMGGGSMHQTARADALR
jgi:hypothetical protein